ncbi:MAG: tRNA 2-thiouridine(34) synthase MnmA [bacterium]
MKRSITNREFLMKNLKNKKVALALSGGVDSAAVGMILKKQGYNLSGLYLKLHPRDTGENQARLVAEYLDIPFYKIDAADKFKKIVIDYFLREYKEGRTPNPCVLCNKEIKFGLLYERARKMGFDILTTGHYIKLKACPERSRRVKSPSFAEATEGKQKSKVSGANVNFTKYRIFTGDDKKKDQSYFLYNLNQEILAHALFPLGGYKKEEIKKMAKKWNLPVYEKESQDICFLNRGLYADSNADYTRIVDHNEFLKKHLKLKRGDILNLRGEKMGEHEGLALYTIGQRRAVGIGGTGPYYVIKKDIEKNILVVSEDKDDPALYKDELEIKDVNWIRGEEAKLPIKVKVKIRYGHEGEEAIIKSKVKMPALSDSRTGQKSKVNDGYFIRFEKPQRAITAGQSAVFYKGSEMIGGGIIL